MIMGTRTGTPTFKGTVFIVSGGQENIATKVMIFPVTYDHLVCWQ